jgi:transposase
MVLRQGTVGRIACLKILEKTVFRLHWRRNSTHGNHYVDFGLYRYRHLVENVFARLKHFHALATRFDKLKKHYEGVVATACALL